VTPQVQKERPPTKQAALIIRPISAHILPICQRVLGLGCNPAQILPKPCSLWAECGRPPWLGPNPAQILLTSGGVWASALIRPLILNYPQFLRPICHLRKGSHVGLILFKLRKMQNNTFFPHIEGAPWKYEPTMRHSKTKLGLAVKFTSGIFVKDPS
jgi:hypothetical protein